METPEFVYLFPSINKLTFIQYIQSSKRKSNLTDWARTREKDIGSHPQNRNNSLLFRQRLSLVYLETNFCHMPYDMIHNVETLSLWLKYQCIYLFKDSIGMATIYLADPQATKYNSLS